MRLTLLEGSFRATPEEWEAVARLLEDQGEGRIAKAIRTGCQNASSHRKDNGTWDHDHNFTPGPSVRQLRFRGGSVWKILTAKQTLEDRATKTGIGEGPG